VNQNFKETAGGWTTVGASAKASVSHDAEITSPIAGALKLEYAITKGDFSAIYLPVISGDWARAKSIKFRVHTDANTLLAVTLQEQDGGKYLSLIQAPKDAWQTVELSTSDFILGQDPGDPKDPDGKLDMDRISNISIFDVSQFFLAIDNPGLSELLDIKKGNHALYLDSFVVSTEAVPTSAASTGDDVQIDTLVHPQIAWLGLGVSKISRSTEKPLDGPSLRVDYHQRPGKPCVITRSISSWLLTGSKTLSLDLASAQPAQLIVQLEQVDGGKYNMSVAVAGGSVVQHKKLLLSGFIRSDDSKDTETKPHLALVKSITIIDASGMISQADHDNTLWVNA
jgi:hypothetical protein